MVCRLVNAKPLSKPIISHQSHWNEQTSVKTLAKLINFYWNKMHLKVISVILPQFFFQGESQQPDNAYIFLDSKPMWHIIAKTTYINVQQTLFINSYVSIPENVLNLLSAVLSLFWSGADVSICCDWDPMFLHLAAGVTLCSIRPANGFPPLWPHNNNGHNDWATNHHLSAIMASDGCYPRACISKRNPDWYTCWLTSIFNMVSDWLAAQLELKLQIIYCHQASILIVADCSSSKLHMMIFNEIKIICFHIW